MNVKQSWGGLLDDKKCEKGHRLFGESACEKCEINAFREESGRRDDRRVVCDEANTATARANHAAYKANALEFHALIREQNEQMRQIADALEKLTGSAPAAQGGGDR